MLNFNDGHPYPVHGFSYDTDVQPRYVRPKECNGYQSQRGLPDNPEYLLPQVVKLLMQVLTTSTQEQILSQYGIVMAMGHRFNVSPSVYMLKWKSPILMPTSTGFNIYQPECNVLEARDINNEVLGSIRCPNITDINGLLKAVNFLRSFRN